MGWASVGFGQAREVEMGEQASDTVYRARRVLLGLYGALVVWCLGYGIAGIVELVVGRDRGAWPIFGALLWIAAAVWCAVMLVDLHRSRLVISASKVEAHRSSSTVVVLRERLLDVRIDHSSPSRLCLVRDDLSEVPVPAGLVIGSARTPIQQRDQLRTDLGVPVQVEPEVGESGGREMGPR